MVIGIRRPQCNNLSTNPPRSISSSRTPSSRPAPAPHLRRLEELSYSECPHSQCWRRVTETRCRRRPPEMRKDSHHFKICPMLLTIAISRNKCKSSLTAALMTNSIRSPRLSAAICRRHHPPRPRRRFKNKASLASSIRWLAPLGCSLRNLISRTSSRYSRSRLI